MKILFIGDIVARPGRTAVKEVLPQIINEEKVDLVLANCENLAHGRGATVDTIQEMKIAGVDYFTSGDHIYWHRDFDSEIDNLPILVPANLPGDAPGKKSTIIDVAGKGKVLLINLMGRTFLKETLDDPFTKFDEILDSYEQDEYDFVVVDFHAEATSEKMAFGFYVDGRATAVVGTHTHVPTCDQFVLPLGTMYISDIGMSGNVDSVLGVNKEIIINKYLSALNQRFEWENTGRKAFRGVILDTDKKNIYRFDKNLY